MKLLDLKLGYLICSEDYELGNILFLTEEQFRTVKPKTYQTITLRDFIFATIGSCNFTYKQEYAISKLFNEYKDLIDMEAIKPYVMRYKDRILVSTDISTTLKLYGLFTLANCELSDDLECIPMLVTQTDSKAEVNFMLGYIRRAVNELSLRILNLLKIKVFKKRIKAEEYSSPHFNALHDLLELKVLTLKAVVIKDLFAYSGTSIVDEYRNMYYRDDETMKEVANQIIKLMKPMKFNESCFEQLLKTQSFVDAVKRVSDEYSLDTFGLVDTCFTVMSTTGYYLKDLDSEDWYSVILELQQFANILSHFNLSVRYLDELQNKDKLFKYAIYMSANITNTRKELIHRLYGTYVKLAVQSYMQDANSKDIDYVMSELESNYVQMKQNSERDKQLEEMKLVIAQQNSEIQRLKTSLDESNTDIIHKSYYKMIRELNNEIDMLTVKLEEQQSKVVDSKPVIETNHSDVSIENKSILFIGHPEAKETVNQLPCNRVTFLDGTVYTQPIDKSKYDIVCYQWQFIPHESRKYMEYHKDSNAVIVNVKGTNLNNWVTQIKKELINKGL